jgi:hypothetical protein
MTDLVTVDRLQENEEHFVNAIVETQGENLPANVQDVLNVFEFTDWKAKAWKTLSDKLSKLDDQQEAYHSALRSGQQWGIAALYAQKRMGEITREMPTAENSNQYAGSRQGKGKVATLKDSGISGHIYTDAERIASHPEILDRVIESSQQRGEIPTKSAVLNTIKAETAKERASQKEKKQADRVENQRPRAVAEYYEAVKQYREALRLAMQAAKRGKFAPEGINLLTKKHDEIREMMNELEEMI